ncbi:DUF6292 family protein [Amycolatopsis solani]|uniref:DUF6292 family protein n=1 Tax=Amycolatopsis solani TaxID=3028615 RepID=UPI0025B1AD68|nr:DUF6292 family protein [Amycolatopsis sp. MEP2-6]
METHLSGRQSALAYLGDVATVLGLPLEDAAVEPDDPRYGQIRFAGCPADATATSLALLWDSAGGWQLAAAEGRSGSLHVFAELRGESTPDPRAVADFALGALAARGERLVRRQCAGDRLSRVLDRYAGCRRSFARPHTG